MQKRKPKPKPSNGVITTQPVGKPKPVRPPNYSPGRPANKPHWR